MHLLTFVYLHVLALTVVGVYVYAPPQR